MIFVGGGGGGEVIQYSMNIALIQPYSSFQGSTLTRHTSLAPADESEGTLGTRLTSQNSNKQTFQIELSAWMLFYVKYSRKSQ